MASNVVVPSHKVLYQIVEVKGRKKPVWNRAGVGFTNRDGSMNITVDALPGCRFQLRNPNAKSEAAPAKKKRK
jgi:hypothetical protein